MRVMHPAYGSGEAGYEEMITRRDFKQLSSSIHQCHKRTNDMNNKSYLSLDAFAKAIYHAEASWEKHTRIREEVPGQKVYHPKKTQETSRTQIHALEFFDRKIFETFHQNLQTAKLFFL